MHAGHAWGMFLKCGGISLALAASTALAGPMFQGLGDLPGGDIYSAAYGISADGMTVVGSSHIATGPRGFFWTREQGMVALSKLTLGGASSSATAVSADGRIIAGTVDVFGQKSAGVWVGNAPPVLIPTLSGNYGFGSGISADGDVVVGQSGDRAFRYQRSTGTLMALPPTGPLMSPRSASGVSADGEVVVGTAVVPGHSEAFRWTSATGVVTLGSLSEHSPGSDALDISADGTTIVGTSNSTYGTEAFRWRSDTGMIGLGDLPGSFFGSVATGVSADGTVIVGAGNVINDVEVPGSPIYQDAFIWDITHGMRKLQDVLTLDCGLDLTGWRLRFAQAVSADGQTIAGRGINPNGYVEAWVAQLPEPASVAMLSVLIVTTLRPRQRVR